MAIEYFCCYHSYLDVMEQLNDAEKGRLFTACLIYSKTGEAPQLSGNERFVFPTFRAQIDRDNARYDERCKQQSANARKRWDAVACQSMPNDANDANTKTKAKEKAKTKTKEKEKGDIPPSPLPVRHKFGEYKNVLLTDEDLAKLKAEFSDWEARIERLSSYIAQSGKSYKNHLATIRNWAKKDKESGKDAGADQRGAESNMSGAFGTWL